MDAMARMRLIGLVTWRWGGVGGAARLSGRSHDNGDHVPVVVLRDECFGGRDGKTRRHHHGDCKADAETPDNTRHVVNASGRRIEWEARPLLTGSPLTGGS